MKRCSRRLGYQGSENSTAGHSTISKVTHQRQYKEVCIIWPLGLLSTSLWSGVEDLQYWASRQCRSGFEQCSLQEGPCVATG